MLGLQRYCHYICHWICSVRCRLICEIQSAPDKPLYLIGCTHLVAALQQAGSAVARLVADAKTLAAVEHGVLAGNCEIVRVALERGGYQGACHWICLWICNWRRVRVCVLLCRPYPVAQIEHELAEIHAFAKVVSTVAKRPGMAAKLVDAVDTENADACAALVKEHGRS